MIRRFLPVAFLLLHAVAANAEVLTLDQAIERALNTDPRIEERQYLVESARALLREALGNEDLIFDVNAYVGIVNRVDDGFFAADGVTPRSDKYDWGGLTPWTNVEFSIIKPLYTFGKIENYADAARGNIEVKQGDVLLQRGNTVIDVKRAYYGYLTARDTRYLFEDVIKRLDKAISLVEKWLKEGNSGIRQSNLFALQSGLALVNKYKAQAQAVEEIALAGLKLLTGTDKGQVLEVADQRIAPVPLPELDLDKLQQKALKQRPEMMQLDAGLRARRSLVAAHKAEVMPNLYAGFGGFAAYTPHRSRLDNPFIYDPFNDYGATPVVGMQWQWSQGAQPAKVAQAQAELDALIKKSVFAQKGIPFEVAEQYHQVQAHYEAVQKLAQGSRSARRWMISSYADFEAGIEKAEDTLAAFQGYVLTHSEYLGVVNDYNMHVARLQLVTGDYQ